MATPKLYGWQELFMLLLFGIVAFSFGVIAGNKTSCIENGLKETCGVTITPDNGNYNSWVVKQCRLHEGRECPIYKKISDTLKAGREQ